MVRSRHALTKCTKADRALRVAGRLDTRSRIGANLRSSLPGLTRQSIDLRKNFLAKKMDARVNPAHDELAKQLKLAPMRVRVRGRVHTGPFVPLTPSLSPRQERGEGAARCLLHGLCINFTGAFH